MKFIHNIVIVGGGTAGWLTAALIASQHQKTEQSPINITLIESSDIPTVGVGEGTWPTMKNTLKQIGISEKMFMSCCHATFKQGGKFVNWVHGTNDFYYHPFTVPLGYNRIDLAPYLDDVSQFSPLTNFQQALCEAGLAPKTMADIEYQSQFQCNYAYHLDAGKFATLLKNHCQQQFRVKHIVDTVHSVKLALNGDIDAVVLTKQGEVHGDLFVDCTGLQSLLLGKTLNIGFKSVERYLFNNRAVAIQVPYADPQQPIACHTIATAHEAGWTWDIGLTHRRGTGLVYSDQFATDEQAEQCLRQYLGSSALDLDARVIKYDPGHREKWWHRNCVAVGMAAGFLEPLEATAIMLIELSARYIAENLPPTSEALPVIANRFNQQMSYRWQRIVDFLKLHYLLTQRKEPYWQAHTDEATIPETLKEDLAMWQYRGPVTQDFNSAIELFPAASYQYVLYGMEFRPDFDSQRYLYQQHQQAETVLQSNQNLTQQLLKTLPKHRDFLEQWLAK
jgi:tryptophan halogenase